MDDSTQDYGGTSDGAAIRQDRGRRDAAERNHCGLETASLLEALGVAIFVADEKQHIQAWNSAAGALLGGTAQMRIGLSLRILAGLQDEGRFEAALQAAIDHGEQTILRRFALHIGGPRATYVHACVTPLLVRKGAQRGFLITAVAARRDDAPTADEHGSAFIALMHGLTEGAGHRRHAHGRSLHRRVLGTAGQPRDPGQEPFPSSEALGCRVQRRRRITRLSRSPG